MTTGDPLVVRGYMKPLPTLTKPLRSVDIATHEPAEALRERTDSCTVPAAGVVAEAMVAFVLADAYRRKFGGDHIEDVRAAVARLPRANRMGATLGADRVVAIVGFMGAGKSTAARSAAEALGAGVIDVDDELERREGRTIDAIFAHDGEDRFRALEERLILELLDGAQARDARAGPRRRGARVRAGPRRAAPTTSSSGSTSTSTPPGRGAAPAPVRWPPTVSGSRGCTSSASPSTPLPPMSSFPTSARCGWPRCWRRLRGFRPGRRCCGR